MSFAIVFSSCAKREAEFLCIPHNNCRTHFRSLNSSEVKRSISDLSFLLQSLVSPLNQCVEAVQLMLQLKCLSLLPVVCSFVLHLQATAGTTHG